MPFKYEYRIQFRDTDAAGVVYFANVLTLCHLAYENSLIQIGMDLKSFVTNPELAVPITHTEADFIRPMFCGDRVTIELVPLQLSKDSFEIQYQILPPNLDREILKRSEFADAHKPRLYAKALTRHISINPTTRKRQDLPDILRQWLDSINS
jgi:1,4-dihydroxy-2-naphthoyl-CoA hydrolase